MIQAIREFDMRSVEAESNFSYQWQPIAHAIAPMPDLAILPQVLESSFTFSSAKLNVANTLSIDATPDGQAPKA